MIFINNQQKSTIIISKQCIILADQSRYSGKFTRTF